MSQVLSLYINFIAFRTSAFAFFTTYRTVEGIFHAVLRMASCH